MLSRVMAMGLLLLRATATLAWAPAVRLGRLPARSGACAEFRHNYRSTLPVATRIRTRTAGSSRSLWTRCLSRSPSSASSSSSDNGFPSAAGAATVPVVVSGEGEEEQIASDEDVGLRAGKQEEEEGERGSGALLGGVEIQPLLRKHIDMLGPRGRRKVKTRQHVNPLASNNQEPAVLLEGWFKAAFREPSAPLLVDIGCAKGSFLRSMATERPGQNYLGLEIRRPTAAVALERMVELGTGNCHLVCCNANVDLDAVLTEAARNGASIDTICIQFPDPHFKTKHYKRRVMQPELVTCIEKHLRPGGTLFMQSDVLDVVHDMRVITREAAEVLEDSRPDMDDWMEGPENNPFGIQTERETATYLKESPEENRVYRCVFVKK